MIRLEKQSEKTESGRENFWSKIQLKGPGTTLNDVKQ